MLLEELDNEIARLKLGKNPNVASKTLGELMPPRHSPEYEKFLVLYADYITYITVYQELYDEKHSHSTQSVATAKPKKHSSLDRLAASGWTRSTIKRRSWN